MKPFRIYDSWFSNEGFISLAKDESHQQKLKRIKTLAKEWTSKLGNSTKQVEQARRELDREASLLVKNPYSELLQEKMRGLEAKSIEKMAIEKVDLKQISKINGLKLGDINSKFFSLSIKIRKSRNSTFRLLNSDGGQVLTRSQLENKSVKYFTKIIGANQRPLVVAPHSYIWVVSEEMNAWLSHNPLEKEVRVALMVSLRDVSLGLNS